MVELCENELCTGCSSCMNICTKNAINMVQNNEGFEYPVIETSKCIECGLCQKACPQLHCKPHYKVFDQKVYACISTDSEFLMKSASGGAFFELARIVIENKGLVFGASYDENMRVYHCKAESIKELTNLLSTKYVQSSIGNSYKLVKKALEEDRIVLFSGTGCQIDGLYFFLKKDYSNLYTCDLLCKGVPSPGIFKKYISYLENKIGDTIINLNFRDKTYLWGSNTTLETKSNKKKLLRGIDGTFVRMVGMGMVRKSCYSCVFTNKTRVGDLTLADFWKIGENKFYKENTEKGCSAVIVNSKKGEELIELTKEKLLIDLRDMEELISGQSSALSHPIKEPINRKELFEKAFSLNYDEFSKKYLLEKSLKRKVFDIFPIQFEVMVQKGLRAKRKIK